MEIFVLLFIGLVFSAIPVSILGSVSKAFGDEAKRDEHPLDTRVAIVAAKRLQVMGADHPMTFYFVTFEFADGSRREIRMSGRVYGTLAEGDRGTLTTKGGRFISFKRTGRNWDAGAADAGHKCNACGAPYTGRVCPYCGTPWRN